MESNRLKLDLINLNKQIEELINKRKEIKNNIKKLAFYKKLQIYDTIDYVSPNNTFPYDLENTNISIYQNIKLTGYRILINRDWKHYIREDDMVICNDSLWKCVHDNISKINQEYNNKNPESKIINNYIYIDDDLLEKNLKNILIDENTINQHDNQHDFNNLIKIEGYIMVNILRIMKINF
uniref:Uncharacterized protein n=1 Tax=Pithovirus LCDPAC02 TaxID=2506601 RepID=A0A481YNU5_9VIRU|nr:MAG: hypothetical protein LCDPAC02_01310 [Pithovirus LCDPAC02]